MKLDTLTLKAKIESNNPAKKITIYPYLWRDESEVEESGLGPRQLVVGGYVETAAERDALEQKLEASGWKRLYFASELGQTDDRYYKVFTYTAQFTPDHSSLYRYRFVAVAADPSVYLTVNDEAVW